MSQIIVNDLDPKKELKIEDFFKQATHKPGQPKAVLETDADFDVLFTKLAEEWKPSSFEEFETKVHDTFEGKVDPNLERWANKLKLDRVKLKNVFSY